MTGLRPQPKSAVSSLPEGLRPRSTTTESTGLGGSNPVRSSSQSAICAYLCIAAETSRVHAGFSTRKGTGDATVWTRASTASVHLIFGCQSLTAGKVVNQHPKITPRYHLKFPPSLGVVRSLGYFSLTTLS